MILIAPDKYKGTLSARQASTIIAEALADNFCLMAPMADGGEGTAAAIAHGPEWQQHDCYFVHRQSRIAVIDSSAVIGMNAFIGQDILKASSAPLGIKVREILKSGCSKVIIGIGGTGCCDAGVGFLEGLGLDKYTTYHNQIIGLSDVAVPLLPPHNLDDADATTYPCALMFAPQKGALQCDIPVLRSRLRHAQLVYGQGKSSIFDGAGGGLGFAIATAIGAPCYAGAQYVLDNYHINWHDVSLVITGEGRIDRQTEQGKVVDTIARNASAHGIPCIAIAGSVTLTQREQSKLPYTIIDASQFMSSAHLNSDTAALRLSAATRSISALIAQQFS